MALKVNCDGFQRDRYFMRSWSLITQDQGWIKPILLLTLAKLVPILGPLGASGYIVEWARLVAWDVNAAPKQRGVNIGQCIASGWRTFVVCLGWGALMVLAFMLLGLVPILGALLALAATIFCLYLEQLLRVAVLRASIYQQLGAGYKASRIWEMGERDVEGLIRILGIDVVGNLIIGLVLSIVGSIVLVAMIPAFAALFDQFEAFYYASDQEILELTKQLVNSFLAFSPAFVIVSLVATFFSTLLDMIVMGAVGLWMRQFNVPAWGRSDDPLPQPIPETVVGYQGAQNPAGAYPGYGYAQPNAQGYGYGDQQYPSQQPPYQYGYGQYAPDQYGYGQQASAQGYGYAQQATAQATAYGYGQPTQDQYPYAAQEPYAYEPQAEAAPEAFAQEATFVPEPEVAPIFEAAATEAAPAIEEAAQEAAELAEAAEAVAEAAPAVEFAEAFEAEPAPERDFAEEVAPAEEAAPESEPAEEPASEPAPAEDATLDMPRPID